MLATRTVRCQVIAIDAHNNVTELHRADRHPGAVTLVEETSAPRFRPSDLVPWADPYIAGLVRRLQSDVRKEVAEAKQSTNSRFAPPAVNYPVADLEWPWDGGVTDMESVETEEPTSNDGLNWDQRF